MNEQAVVPTWISALSDPATPTVVVELHRTRLARVVLMPSPIWMYVIDEQRHNQSILVSLTWKTLWDDAYAKASTKQDIDYLNNFGYNPEGVFDVRTKLAQELQKILPNLARAPSTSILIIGSFARFPIIGKTLRPLVGRGDALAFRDDLRLPDDLRVATVRAQIAQRFPPRAPATYFLSTLKPILNETETKFELERVPLVTKGAPPPVLDGTMPNVGALPLFRVIPAPGENPVPLYLILRDGELKAAQVFQVNPTSNMLKLKWWLDYPSGQLQVRALDLAKSSAPANADNSLREVDVQQADTLEKLPTLRLTRQVDLVFILDGTLRRKVKGEEGDEWLPDLEPDKNFLQTLLKQVEQETQLDLHCGMCLYGDNKKITGSAYAFRPFPLAALNDSQRWLEQCLTNAATADWDYEALLENALAWSNPINRNSNAGWRPNAEKWLIVIGYAPPHPFQGRDVYDPNVPFSYDKYRFKHEPMTSPIDWLEQIQQLRQQKVHTIGIWVPYPEIDLNHPCKHYSRDVWQYIGYERGHYFVNLEETHVPPIAKLINEFFERRYLPSQPVQLPVTKQAHTKDYSIRNTSL